MGLLQPPAAAGEMVAPEEQQTGAMPPEPAGEAMEQDQPDPALDKAVEWMQTKLYGDTKLAEKVRGVAKGGGDPVRLLADMAYKLAAAADEATGGEIAEENIVSLGAFAIAELYDIADAVGVQLEPADMMAGLRSMVMRFLQENGASPEQIKGLQQAMNQYSAKDFNKFVKEAPDGE